MTIVVLVMLYLLFTLVVGLVGYRSTEKTPDGYFLAGRRIGPVVLFFTLISTNFSAFYFLGFAGAGYRIGYSYYGIMAFGTALVGLAFYFIGFAVWRLGKQHGYITPPELIGDRFKSRALRVVVVTVMVVFTLPYLAIQPIGAGYLLAELTGGTIPYFSGAILLTVCMVVYVFLGGMRGVAATDVLQGALMFLLMLLAIAVIGRALGGIGAANATVFESNPALFSREGAGQFFTPRRWFSFMILWLLAVPMFPQVFMRFFVPRSPDSLRVAATLYPVVTAALFIGPILIGVLGHISHPDLVGTDSDQILPRMLAEYAPGWLSGLIMVGALAAFMSTMDSQLLALSSMVTRDIYLVFVNRRASVERQVIVGRAMVVVLSVVGLAIAYRPPATIFAIATQAFTGLAVLFPTVLAALYYRGATATSCITSIITGETLLAGFHFGLLPESWTLGFLPLIPIVVVCSAVIVLGSEWESGRAAVWFRPAGRATAAGNQPAP